MNRKRREVKREEEEKTDEWRVDGSERRFQKKKGKKICAGEVKGASFEHSSNAQA